MKKKNSTAQLAKLNLQNKHLRDPIIKKLYQKFRINLFQHLSRKKFCVAVSGGPDSLSLTYLSKIFSSEFNYNFIALIVDHNLRKDSHIEAKKVKKILTQQKIKSKILTWRGTVPKTNIQFNARKIRYFLLTKQCKILKIQDILLAHHEDDLIENFFIRLFRGSGLKGLSSLNVTKESENNEINLLRPLVNVKKKDLIYCANKIFKFYLIDPYNYKEKFLRTKIRNYLLKFKKDGLDINKIKLTLNNLQSANRSLNFYREKSKKKYLRYLRKDTCMVNYELFSKESEEIIFRITSDTISKVANRYYSPRGKDVKNLITRIQSDNYKKSTLGGCIFEKTRNSLIFKKEFKTKY